MKSSILLLVFVVGLTACVSQSDSMAKAVSERVEDLTKTPASQERALRELEEMGSSAVPFIVGHLGDVRSLAEPRMSLVNHASDVFEGLRHYSPKTVHDALSAVLNQLTGESFEFVYSGATAEKRASNQTRWTAWCQQNYRETASYCARSI